MEETAVSLATVHECISLFSTQSVSYAVFCVSHLNSFHPYHKAWGAQRGRTVSPRKPWEGGGKTDFSSTDIF